MSSFKNNESYKHKCAKEIFKQWCQSKEWSVGKGNKELLAWNGDRSVLANYSELNERYTSQIRWVPNRDQKAWLEYPIVVKKQENYTFNSLEYLWDEYWYRLQGDDFKYPGKNFVPTYEECVEQNMYPIAVVDIVLPYKGGIGYCIEICHTNPVSDEKVEKLREAGVRNLIEIDADWILSQTGIPSVIKVKRWLI